MDVYRVDKEGRSAKSKSLEGIRLRDDALVWVDAEDPSPEELVSLREFFDIHPLALEPVGEARSIPRVKEFADHLLVAWEFPRDDPATESIETTAVYIVLGKNYLVTLHRDAIPEISSIFEKLDGGEAGTLRRHPAFLLYSILDESVEEFFPLVESLKEGIDAYMDRLVADGGGKGLDQVMHYKHRNMALRRTVSSLRDVVMRLARRELALIPEDMVVYFLDIYDHLTRIYLETDNNSDLISSLLDIHLNVISNRLNVTMKRLTAIATFFMPATFLAGIYGMNFAHMPEINWYYGYLYFWIAIIVITLVMFLVGKRQDWL